MSDAGARTGVREPIESAVAYHSSAVGVYVWHEFDAARVAEDLRAIARRGLQNVRTHLLWDAFLPTPRAVVPARLRHLDVFLRLAQAESLLVTPVLFAQTFADCVMLPAYAIDVAAPRRGVRVVSDAVVQPGGPRDQYTDPLMLEAGELWLRTLLREFAGHPAIAVWDLGQDPATTMRPRRIEHLSAWCARMAAVVHEHGQRCLLTLGDRDVLSGRGVRLGAVAGSVDGLGLAVDAAHLGPDVHPARAAAFLAQLALALAGERVPLLVEAGPPSGSALGDPELHAAARSTVDALVETGCSGLAAAAWSEPGPRAALAPPHDQLLTAGRRALVRADGEPSAWGGGWMERLALEPERVAPQPWPAAFDAADYYANLPGSMLDLRSAWEDERHDPPAMLD